MNNEQQDIRFINVDDESALNPKYDEMPIYVPCLKSAINVGHFVIISILGGNSLVGQIIGRANDPIYPQHFINICCFLPLFSMETRQHMNDPLILP